MESRVINSGSEGDLTDMEWSWYLSGGGQTTQAGIDGGQQLLELLLAQLRVSTIAAHRRAAAIGAFVEQPTHHAAPALLAQGAAAKRTCR